MQKYFIKLARSGLPIPGREPNLTRVLPKVSNVFNDEFDLLLNTLIQLHKKIINNTEITINILATRNPKMKPAGLFQFRLLLDTYAFGVMIA